MHLLAAVEAVHAGRIGWVPRHFDRLAGGPALREALQRRTPPDSIVASWAPALAAYRQRVAPVRLYGP